MNTNVAYAQPAPYVSAPARPAHRLTVVEGGSRFAAAPTVVWKRGTKRSLAWCVACVLAIVLVACALFAAKAFFDQVSYDAATMGLEYTEVSVSKGDTLWTIAEAHPVSGLSTREVIDLVKEWNGLESGLLSPGEVLTVPAA